MQIRNYTSENICLAMGMGGFANDWVMAKAEYGLRLLFKLSDSPEMCLTFIQKDGAVNVSLVAALSPIWQQGWEFLKPEPSIQSQASIDNDSFMQLLDLLMVAECALDKPEYMTLHGGIRVHTVLRGGGYGLINIGDSPANHKTYTAFFIKALELAESNMTDVNARIAFIHFAKPHKQVCRTFILGEQEESVHIMQALHKLHAQG